MTDQELVVQLIYLGTDFELEPLINSRTRQPYLITFVNGQKFKAVKNTRFPFHQWKWKQTV